MYHLFEVANKYNSTIMPVKFDINFANFQQNSNTGQITFDTEFMKSNFHCCFQLEKVSQFVILDFNECALSTTCDTNAQCTNIPEDFSFHCNCSNGYEGDGFACVKVVTRNITIEARETKVEVQECKIWLFLAFYAAPDI